MCKYLRKRIMYRYRLKIVCCFDCSDLTLVKEHSMISDSQKIGLLRGYLDGGSRLVFPTIFLAVPHWLTIQ